MKHLPLFTAASLTLLLVIYAAAGVLPHNPLAALGLGLIGLGLIRCCRPQPGGALVTARSRRGPTPRPPRR